MNAFDKIIGYSSEKKELERISDILKNREIYKKLGVFSPKGLLLHGEPGVGKTLMANALIKASGRKKFVCRKDQPNGDFIKTIKKTFNEAVKNAPSIVFLDDMDKFANGDERHRDAEEYVTVQSCIDEAKGTEVFVLATANNVRNLPHSLMRAGRFDRVIEIEAPHGADAVQIIKHYLDSKKFVSGIDVEMISRIMDGRSCAELETVINEAGIYAGYDREKEITMEHFMKACMRNIFNVPIMANEGKDDYTNLADGNNILSQIVYHEAGHAVISEILCPESVTLISAYNRKGRSGGFTSYYNDSTYGPIKWKQSRIIASLGGMAALEQKYGIVDSGSTRDLDQAFSAVRNLITSNCVCGFHLHEDEYRSDSEELLAKQEQAVVSEIWRYYRKAKEMLSLNNAFFEKTAVALAKKKLLTMADIQEIKKDCNIISIAII